MVWIKKKFNINEKIGWYYKPVNNLHKWLERSFLIVWFAFIMVGLTLGISVKSYFLFIFLLVFAGLRAFMEWKYEVETKRYYLSLINVIQVLIILIILL